MQGSRTRWNILRSAVLLCYFLLCSWVVSAQEQTASVSGQVLSENGEPLSYANVQLLNSKIGTVSSDSGFFNLKGIPAGTYHLEISFIGYQNLIRVFTLKPGQVMQLGRISMQEQQTELESVVVSATRTERNVEDVPLPVTVISGEQVQNMGSMRLKDVLEEQTGLNIVTDHGNGVQVQGFNSDYTMILINGQPLVGRTAGTMELDRITVNNIKQIEITKGPSSSLFGNEALAGVINIITEDPNKPLAFTLNTRYRTYNTKDINGSVEMKRKKLGAFVHVNNYSSDGYDLTPESISRTAPEFNSYTVSGDFTYETGKKSMLKLNSRYYTVTTHDRSEININSVPYILDFKGDKNDWNLAPTFTYEFTPHSKLTLTNYTTGYNTKSLHRYESDGTMYSEGYFNQLFNKSEAQADIRLNKTNVLTSGAGYILETLKSDRYEGLNSFNTVYGYLQNEWTPFQKKLTVLAGARFDSHSEYSSQLSPKLAVQYKWKKWLKLKATAGTGFKAPDFRQLFLNFTNPTVGYSVFGASIVKDGMLELENQGQVQSILIDYNTIETIKAESSVAYNFGIDLKPHKKITLKVNLFRNDISNLIESAPIAIKTNGQQVFSYFNINQVYTQGLESELKIKLLKQLTVSAGYQYLEAKDKDVIQQLEEGKIFATDPETSQTIRVKPSQYGGLFNRSKHSGTFKIFYHNDSLKFDVSLRGIYRGDFGFGDVNNNAILDSDLEYVKGYTTWRVAVTKRMLKDDKLHLQVGVDNLFGTTNEFVPTMPGQFYYVGAALTLTKKPKPKSGTTSK